MKKLLLAGLLLCASWGVASYAQDTCEYKQELNAFETNPRYKDIFDEEIHSSLQSIQTDIETYKQISFFQRAIRFMFFTLDVVVVTPVTMPRLYSFIDAICKDKGIETPTIFIAKNRGFLNAAASKLLISSGAIVIGKKLIHDCSDKEIEAIAAHELGHIVYNHVNKGILLSALSYYAIKWSKQYLCNYSDNNFDWNAYYLATFMTGCATSKRFEREADHFACEATGTGEGIVAFFERLKDKEQAEEKCFDTTYRLVQESYPEITYSDYCRLMFRYYLAKTGHLIGKGFQWIADNTPLGSHPSHDERIETARQYDQA